MKFFLYACAFLVLLGAALVWFTYRTARRIERFLPPKGRFVEVPGARLHVREFGINEGSGPAILLVHGLAGQTGHFDYGLAERLATRFRVLAIDRPGSGHSLRAPGSPADVSAQAASLAALIQQLQLGRPLVVGHSLGGAVALALAQEHPDTVGALALVAPLTHTPDAPPDVFKALTIASAPLRRLFAWTLATPGAIAGSRKVLAAVFSPEAVPDDFAVRGGGLLGLRPAAFLAACDDMQAISLRMPAVEAGYAGLSLAVSVLYGRQDAILDWRRNGQGLVDKLPGARLELVDGGHMLPVTQPEATAAFIERAASGLPAGPALR